MRAKRHEGSVEEPSPETLTIYLDIHHADEIPATQGEPVRVFRFASQQVETVAMVPTDWAQILPGFTVDRAGARFLWNQIDQHTSDLMLIDEFR